MRGADRRRARRGGRCGAGDPRGRARRCKSNALDPAFKAEAILLPSESLIADRMEVVDPDAIHAVARSAARRRSARRCADDLLAAHRSDGAAGDDLSPDAKGIRRLRTVALGLIAAADAAQAAALAKAQFDARRQYDRPPGRARHPRVARRAGAAGGARRFLRALPRRSAGARQMVRAAGRGAARRTRSTRC